MQKLARFISLAFASALIALPSTASASTIYDVSLGGPGFFNGSGNPDGGFTVVSNGDVLVALRVKGRQDPNVIHTPTDTYNVQAGSQIGVPTRAWWNVEFSVDVCAGADNCGRALEDYLPYSTFTVYDFTQGVSMSVSLPYYPDNATWGAGGEGIAQYATDWIAQNSQNPVFGNFPLNLIPGYTFDMNLARHYGVEIVLRDDQQNVLASNLINILVGDAVAVPEPASLTLLGLGLVAGVRRMRRKA